MAGMLVGALTAAIIWRNGAWFGLYENVVPRIFPAANGGAVLFPVLLDESSIRLARHGKVC